MEGVVFLLSLLATCYPPPPVGFRAILRSVSWSPVGFVLPLPCYFPSPPFRLFLPRRFHSPLSVLFFAVGFRASLLVSCSPVGFVLPSAFLSPLSVSCFHVRSCAPCPFFFPVGFRGSLSVSCYPVGFVLHCPFMSPLSAFCPFMSPMSVFLSPVGNRASLTVSCSPVRFCLPRPFRYLSSVFMLLCPFCSPLSLYFPPRSFFALLRRFHIPPSAPTAKLGRGFPLWWLFFGVGGGVGFTTIRRLCTTRRKCSRKKGNILSILCGYYAAPSSFYNVSGDIFREVFNSSYFILKITKHQP